MSLHFRYESTLFDDSTYLGTLSITKTYGWNKYMLELKEQTLAYLSGPSKASFKLLNGKNSSDLRIRIMSCLPLIPLNSIDTNKALVKPMYFYGGHYFRLLFNFHRAVANQFLLKSYKVSLRRQRNPASKSKKVNTHSFRLIYSLFWCEKIELLF